MKPIKTKEFTLRKLRKSDEQAIAKYANNKSIAKNTATIPNPYTLKDAKWFINKCLKDYKTKKDFVLAIDINNELVGALGFHDIKRNHKVKIGYWLGEPFWNRGIMSKAVKEGLKFAFKEFKLKRIDAEVFSFNKGSARVLEKNGFVLEGVSKKGFKKKNKFIDTKNYAKVK